MRVGGGSLFIHTISEEELMFLMFPFCQMNNIQNSVRKISWWKINDIELKRLDNAGHYKKNIRLKKENEEAGVDT